MTDAQQEVYAQVKRLLTEHFDGSVLIVVDDGPEGTVTTCGYTGGLARAIGACRAAEATMLEDTCTRLQRIDEDEA